MIKEEQFEEFMKSLLEINSKINLISRDINKKELFIKHIVDSVMILDLFDFTDVKTILDIGSGGGIPGIPLALKLKNAQITLMDSVEKKMRAANKIISDIKIQNVDTVTGRFENLANQKEYREQYDIVTARAVAKLPTLIEYALPFVKVGGHFIAYKSQNYKEELASSKPALDALGGKLVDVFNYILPENMGSRIYIIIKKNEPTKKSFPRQIGVAKKSPLTD